MHVKSAEKLEKVRESEESIREKPSAEVSLAKDGFGERAGRALALRAAHVNHR